MIARGATQDTFQHGGRKRLPSRGTSRAAQAQPPADGAWIAGRRRGSRMEGSPTPDVWGSTAPITDHDVLRTILRLGGGQHMVMGAVRASDASSEVGARRLTGSTWRSAVSRPSTRYIRRP